MTRRPIGRLVAAVLLAIVLGTSVHGASSVVAPISAIATAHASIGAALFRSASSSVEHDEDRSTFGRAATQRGIDEEFRPPPDESLPDSPPPALLAAVDSSGLLTAPSASVSPIVGSDETATSRTLSGHPSRAPPTLR